MRICIVSDSHDRRDRLAAAVAEAKSLGAQAVIHCGDLVAPSTLHAIIPLGLPVHLVHGNNPGDLYHLAKLAHESKGQVHYYGQDGCFALAGRRIFIVHYPHHGRAMALTGDYDLVCNGRKHRAHVDRVRNVRGSETVWLNPGTVGGVSAPATYVLGDLEKMKFVVRPVPEPAEASARHAAGVRR